MKQQQNKTVLSSLDFTLFYHTPICNILSAEKSYGLKTVLVKKREQQGISYLKR
jgi:hypothetical protein